MPRGKLTTEGPRYEHDCDECVWLGRHDQYDAYACPQPDVGIPTIVLRWGDDGEEYSSGRSLFDELPKHLQDQAQPLVDRWDNEAHGSL